MQLCSYAVMQLCSYAVLQLCSFAVMQFCIIIGFPRRPAPISTIILAVSDAVFNISSLLSFVVYLVMYL
jgi:hypothetical protein